MAVDEDLYENVVPCSSKQLKDKSTGSGRKRTVICAIITTSLLFLSLLANGVLVYLYCTSNIPQPPCNLTLPLSSPSSSPSPLPSSSSVRTCSSGQFSERQVTHRNSLYIFSSDKKTWNASRNRCQELDGDLAVIKSKEEQDFLAKMVDTIGNSELHWIGLTDAEKEDKWLWVDQTPLMENLSWWLYPPDDWKEEDPLGEDCIVYHKGKWTDVSCLYSQRRICEIPCTNQTLHGT